MRLGHGGTTHHKTTPVSRQAMVQQNTPGSIEPTNIDFAIRIPLDTTLIEQLGATVYHLDNPSA